AGVKGPADLREWAKANGHEADAQKLQAELADPAKLAKLLGVELLKRKPEKVVLFLAVHGIASGKDSGLAAYLVPADVSLRDRATLDPLRSVLEALKTLPDSKKLLLLDVTGVTAHWPLGELTNGFPYVLDELAKDVKEIPNLVVIASCDKDERS